MKNLIKFKNLNIKKLILFLCVFFFSFFSIFGLSVEVNINESVEAYDFNTNRVNLVANGEFNFYNPSNNSEIYEFGFKFSPDVVFQTQFSTYSLEVFKSSVVGRDLAAGENLSVRYILRGTIPKSYYDDFKSSGLSLLEWYSYEIYFSPNKHATLNKLNRDYANASNVSSRDVWVMGVNPTEFDVRIDYINLYETDSDDYFAFRDIGNILDTFEKRILKPGQEFYFMGTDEFSDDTSVYWIDYSINALVNLSSIVLVKELAGSVPGTDGGGSGGSNGGSSTGEWFFIDSPLIFTKYVDTWVTSFEDILKISLVVSNSNGVSIPNLFLEDFYPDMFRLVYESEDFRGLNVGDIKAYETRSFEYELEFFNESLDEILFFDSAELTYLNETIYSNSLSVINDLDYLGEKLFVEKVITYNLNGEIIVTIKVKNIGSVVLNDIKIVDSESKNSSNVRSWIIPKLYVNSDWQVSYVLSGGDNLFYVPDVYGTNDAKIYKTIIVNSNVESSGIGTSVSKISIVLGVLVVLLLFVDIIY